MILIESATFGNEFHSGRSNTLKANLFWKIDLEVIIRIAHFATYGAGGVPANSAEFVDPTLGPGLEDSRIKNLSTSNWSIFNGKDVKITGSTSNDGIYTNVTAGIDYIDVSPATLTAESATILVEDVSSYPFINYTFIAGPPGTGLTIMDGSVFQRFTVNWNAAGNPGTTGTVLNLGTVAAETTGGTSWLPSSATVEYLGKIGNSTNRYKFVHTFYIMPFYKVGQLTDYSSGVAPSYFSGTNQLSYRGSFEFSPTNSFSGLDLIDLTPSGQSVGWLNENLNNNTTYYYIQSQKYYNSLGTPVGGVQLISGDYTRVVIELKHFNSTPFDPGKPNKYVINFMYLPEALPASYVNDDQTELLAWDRVLLELDGATLNGDNNGTDYQVIQNAKATHISSSLTELEFEANLGALALFRAQQDSQKKFSIVVSTADPALTNETTDGASVTLGAVTFTFNTGAQDVITKTDGFIEAPYQDKADITDQLNAYPEDEVVYYQRAVFDKSKANGDLKINGLTMTITASNGIEGFSLYAYTFNFDPNNTLGGLTNINEEVTNSFKAPAGEAITKLRLQRDLTADANPIYEFDVYFPFQTRFEDWLPLAASNDFYDIAEQNNGLNNEWSRYDDVTPWGISIVSTWTLEIDGALENVNFIKGINIFDYDENPDWQTTIELFDEFGNLLPDSPSFFLLGYELTKVKVTFEYIGTGLAPVTVDDAAMVFRLGAFEIDTWTGTTRINSERESGAESKWKSIDTSNKIVKAKPTSTTFTGEAFIKNSELTANKYSITARIYDITVIPEGAKYTEAGVLKIEEAGTIKIEE